MAELIDLRDKIRKYYSFTPYEVKGILISIFVVAFIISFKEWGKERFDVGLGLFNLFNSLLIIALSFLVHDAGQRVWGLAIGYRIEYRMAAAGLFIGLVVAFMTNGNLWIIVPGGFMLHHLAGHRLGWFRYGVNYFGQGMVALAGPLSTLTLIIFLKMLNVIVPSPLIGKAIIFNVIFLITSMLPIPPLAGSKIIWGSRMTYAFVFPAIIFATVLLMINIPILIALILSLLVGVVLWILYYISFERQAWTGPK